MAGNIFVSSHSCRSLDIISGTGTARELYESVTNETTGDDLPERELADHPLGYYKGRHSWSGQNDTHRLQGRGTKLQFVTYLGHNDQERVVLAIYEHMKYESATRRRYNLKAETIEHFYHHPQRIKQVALFTSA